MTRPAEELVKLGPLVLSQFKRLDLRGLGDDKNLDDANEVDIQGPVSLAL